MTQDKSRKQAARAYAAAHGVKYTEALRAVQATHAAAQASRAQQGTPSHAVRSRLRDDIGGRDLAQLGQLPVPAPAANLQDPYVNDVLVRPDSYEVVGTTELDYDDEILDVVLEEDVVLGGDLPLAAAQVAYDSGLVEVVGNAAGPMVEVTLVEPVVLVVRANVRVNASKQTAQVHGQPEYAWAR